VVEFDCITLQCSIGVLTGWDLMWVYYSVLFCKYVAPILSVLVLYNLHDTPLTKKNRGNTGKAVVISSDEESADEGKWLPELFLRADDKKLIETGDWLTDRHITAAQVLLKKDFPHVDGLQVTLLAETGGWNILVNEGVQILNDSNIGFVFLQSDAPRTPLTSMTVGTLMYLKTSSSK